MEDVFFEAPKAGDNSNTIEEVILRLPDGRAHYSYIAKIDGLWTDLAPYGNRLPDEKQIPYCCYCGSTVIASPVDAK